MSGGVVDSIDAIRRDLADAGRNPAAVQWGDDPDVELLDGVRLCRRDGEEVVVELLSRDQLVSPERFPSEEAAATALRRRLFAQQTVAKKSPAELAEVRARMLARIALEKAAKEGPLDG